jgi:cytosine/adenosine deaminase-related metal-dependent hydrolase
VYIDEGRIVAVGEAPATASEIVDAAGGLVLPGFVQAHVHLCQTLFRGLADDMEVIEWLRRRVWPLEQAHDAESLRASAELGVAELLLGGTTTVLSMETTHDTEASFEAAAALGIRAVIGPALMDQLEPGSEMLGGHTTAAALDLLAGLRARWHGACGGRLGLAVSPRGVRTATEDLWRASAELASSEGLVLHTHVNESFEQASRLAAAFGARDVYALDGWGALGERTVMAHCVWLEPGEQDRVRARGAHVCHCPSANLKLASGVAPIPGYLSDGINVALGADGAACNNNLSALTEMRLAGLIHKPRHGPAAMPAAAVLRMATMGGARALGMAGEIGSIEVGKKGDVIVLRRDGLHARPVAGSTIESEVVYAHTAADVAVVVVDGRVVVVDGALLTGSEQAIRDQAECQRLAILRRAGL